MIRNRLTQTGPNTRHERTTAVGAKEKVLRYNNWQEKDKLYKIWEAGEQKRNRKLPAKPIGSLIRALYSHSPMTRKATIKYYSGILPGPTLQPNQQDKKRAKEAAQLPAKLMQEVR